MSYQANWKSRALDLTAGFLSDDPAGVAALGQHVRGADIIGRSGGVIVTVRGARPRAVPVLARYHQPLLAAAEFAGDQLVTGDTAQDRRNGLMTAVIALSPAGRQDAIGPTTTRHATRRPPA